MTMGIYEIVCTVHGRTYVGQSADIKMRFSYHRSALKRGKHANIALQNAWNKYGESQFLFYVARIVKDPLLLEAAEQSLLDKLMTEGCRLYNIRPASASNLGTKRSAQARVLTSRAMKRHFLSKENREAHSLAIRPEPCIFRSPLGVLHTVQNLSDFCRENNLSISPMSKVHRGDLMSHKGWTNPTNHHKKKSCKLSEAEKILICQQYEAGESTPVIGKRFGVTSQSICSMLQYRGIPRRPYGWRHPHNLIGNSRRPEQ